MNCPYCNNKINENMSPGNYYIVNNNYYTSWDCDFCQINLSTQWTWFKGGGTLNILSLSTIININNIDYQVVYRNFNKELVIYSKDLTKEIYTIRNFKMINPSQTKSDARKFLQYKVFL